MFRFEGSDTRVLRADATRNRNQLLEVARPRATRPASPVRGLRRWMDLFGDWIATKKGMLDTLLTMIESGEIAHAQTQAELLAAIDAILDAGRATGQLRSDATAEDIAASLMPR